MAWEYEYPVLPLRACLGLALVYSLPRFSHAVTYRTAAQSGEQSTTTDGLLAAPAVWSREESLCLLTTTTSSFAFLVTSSSDERLPSSGGDSPAISNLSLEIEVTCCQVR